MLNIPSKKYLARWSIVCISAALPNFLLSTLLDANKWAMLTGVAIFIILLSFIVRQPAAPLKKQALDKATHPFIAFIIGWIAGLMFSRISVNLTSSLFGINYMPYRLHDDSGFPVRLADGEFWPTLCMTLIHGAILSLVIAFIAVMIYKFNLPRKNSL